MCSESKKPKKADQKYSPNSAPQNHKHNKKKEKRKKKRSILRHKKNYENPFWWPIYFWNIFLTYFNNKKINLKKSFNFSLYTIITC